MSPNQGNNDAEGSGEGDMPPGSEQPSPGNARADGPEPQQNEDEEDDEQPSRPRRTRTNLNNMVSYSIVYLHVALMSSSHHEQKEIGRNFSEK